ncbi:DNA ligase D [Pseudohoeflea suaedae]|uniref:DNA ligase (ATP) n=1 Tax=Pseudohoeflea suaedae TaxID=877384 RepID=A0A4R5PIP6_9HYPH|nr:DNA ligase D [Pseudohoeflea suaedae]TDH35119.1 DNA ligase D [Pseudohoeflea suaedae]
MAEADTSIREYNRKRDFDRTGEPRGKSGRKEKPARLGYLIQKHDATRLHYDFRLELDGVLKSWAVTRGPSYNPEDKRLAVRTEDHPLDYGQFEGVIPKKEYGGGTVMLWDTGWWEPTEDPGKGLKQGKLKFRLHGERLSGAWTLVRMRRKEGEKRDNWLLIKERDEFADAEGDAILERETTSAATGRTMEDIAAGGGKRGKRVWHSEKSAKANVQAGAIPAKKEQPKKPRSAKRKLGSPDFVEPQLATLVDEAPSGEDWLNEIKFDGYRLIVSVGKGGVKCYTRNGLDWTEKFPTIVEACDELDCRNALLDGEAVVESGGSAFSALQKAIKSGGDISYFAFDLLELDGEDLRGKPLRERKEMLHRLIADTGGKLLRYSEHIEGRGEDMHARLCGWDQEGMIAKRADAPYRSGRGRDWLKIKCTRRQELVIGGFSPSDKVGRPFASILLGAYEGRTLVYRGRVGTGFNEARMDELSALFGKRARKTSPFDAVPDDIARDASWLTPDLVAEIDFAEFTADGHVRHGVYKGLREDKEARDVVVEKKSKAPSTSAKNGGRNSGKSGDTVAGVKISSGDRVVFDKGRITKLDIARYYGDVAEHLLKHAAGHPVSFLRAPDGDIGKTFFQKHAGEGFPDQIRRIPIRESSGKTADYMVLDEADDLAGAAQMGTIEFHIWGSAEDKLDKPDRMVFDLDPDEGLGFETVVRSAFEVRDVLEATGLKSVAMVTGGKGVHVVVPLERRADFDQVKTFAKALAGKLADAAPKRYTATMSKAKRKGRIFIDWLRNERGSTAIAPYSIRAREGGPVAVPVSWEELETLKSANGFHIDDVRERLESGLDPWTEADGWSQSVTRKMIDVVSG